MTAWLASDESNVIDAFVRQTTSWTSSIIHSPHGVRGKRRLNCQRSASSSKRCDASLLKREHIESRPTANRSRNARRTATRRVYASSRHAKQTSCWLIDDGCHGAGPVCVALLLTKSVGPSLLTSQASSPSNNCSLPNKSSTPRLLFPSCLFIA